MTRWVPIIALVTLSTASSSSCARTGTLPLAAHVPQFATQLHTLTQQRPSWVEPSDLGVRLWSTEQQFYEAAGYQPVWIDGTHPTSQLTELLQTLSDADLHGLEPARYDVDLLSAELERAKSTTRRPSFDEARVPELDLRLTYAFLTYAGDLLGWSSSSLDVDPNWISTPVKADLLADLRMALDSNHVRATLDDYAPSHPQYKGLQAALARARQAPAEAGSDAAAQHQLIRMNLERWRWMPRDLGDTHILINVPAYTMQVLEHGQQALAMRVIVGALDNPTPLFSDEMTYVVFSPYWNIPTKILREETLPRAAKDPDYLRRNNIEVVGTSGNADDSEGTDAIDWSDPEATRGLRLRQAPGPGNALGLVKFIFPNPFNVYLHDTPNDALFNKTKRTLSHGCVRVEQPVVLAQYVLRDRPEWTAPRIQSAMTSASEQSVILKKALPVHIGYWTAWAEPDGTVTFFADPYGLDAKQAKNLH